MSNDVLITPASRKIEFKDSEGNVDAKIETDASGNLSISNTGGDISIGDTSSDVFIGDGTNSVDIVFEQNGEIRGTSGVTLTLGDSNTTLRTGTDLSLNGNDITNVNDLTITGNLTVSGTTTTLNTSTLQVQDKNIVLNYGTGDTSGSADGAGITIQDAVDSTTDASMTWSAAGDNFNFSHSVNTLGYLQHSSYLYSRNDLRVLNSAGSGWNTWATRSNGQFNLSVGTITSGVISASGGVHTFGGGTSDYAATFSSTDAYSGIKFQDPDGSGIIYYRGATNHFYLHNSTFAVGGSTLATNFEFQVNGDANITGGLATGGTTRISNTGALSNVTANASIITAGTISGDRIPNLSGDKITSVTTLSDTSWHDVVAFDGSTLKRDTAVELHGSGYLRASYLNMTHSVGTRSSDTIFYSSNDDYIRKTNATGMRDALSVYSKSESDNRYLSSIAEDTTTGSLIINEDWSSGTYNEVLTLKGTYPSMAFRSTNANSNAGTVWLFHVESSGDMTFYNQANSVEGSSWTKRLDLEEDGDLILPTGRLESTYGMFTTVGSNTAPSADDLFVSGYGIMGNRTSPVYVTNSNSGGVEINVGGTHSNGKKAFFASDGLRLYGPSADWNETTQGGTRGALHLDPQSASNNFGSAITWGASDTGSGDTAQAGIYVRSDGNYGTKMYISTTDDYGSGSKTAIQIDHAGHTRIKRGNFYMDAGRIFNIDGGPSAPAYSFVNDGDTGIYRNNSNDFGFTTGGSSRFRINNDGLTADNNSNIRGTTDSGIYTYHSSSGGFVLKPGGAQYVTGTSTVTGACKIELPVYASNDMISFWVDIYDYRGGTMTSYFIGGYVYQGEGNNEWVNESAICIAEESNTTTACRTVRFGVQSNKHCIWIGDTDDTWSYPQVVVRDLQGGYSTNIDAWADGWGISFVTSLGTVDHTRATSGPRIGNEAGDVSVRRDMYLEGNSTRSQIGMKAAGSTRGYFYANTSNEVGILDATGNWGVRHKYNQGTEFRTDGGVLRASIGSDLVSGDYGSMVVYETKNGWLGYSLNNRSLFMHDNSNTTGIYNDVDNEWFAKFVRNSASYIYFNGHPTITTTNPGVNIDATSAQTYVEMRLQTNSTTRGYVYANTSNQVGILDAGGHWAIRHTNDQGTTFNTDGGTEHAAIGADLVGGSFGSMVVKDTKSGWGGYSINDRVVFMHDNANTSGIYNDVNNHWMLKTVNGADVELYYNGSKKLETTSTGVAVTGNISHDGLTPTSGTDIDQIYTVTDSLTITTSYQDTSINSSELATGTYILQMHTNDNGNGGSHYNEYYSGVISWYGSTTNSSEVDEIVLHRAGHAPNASVIHLRTQRHPSGGDNLVLQIKANYTRTAASNYTFKFRRMI